MRICDFKKGESVYEYNFPNKPRVLGVREGHLMLFKKHVWVDSEKIKVKEVYLLNP